MEARLLREQDIEFSYCKSTYCIGDPVSLQVRINKRPFARVTVKFDGDSYFEETDSLIYFLNDTITLFPKAGVTVDDLQKVLRFRIVSDRTVLSVCIALSLGISIASTPNLSIVERFTGDLYKSKDIKNILLFGVAGSTKSSFVNSCFTLLSPKMCMEIALSGGHRNRVTTEIKSYRLSNIHTRTGTSYRLDLNNTSQLIRLIQIVGLLGA
jgi:hypothetical protein